MFPNQMQHCNSCKCNWCNAFLNAMADDWKGGDCDNIFNRQEWCATTITKLKYYESVYQKLKEST